MKPAEPRDGDYCVNAGIGTKADREDSLRILRNNGCNSFRFASYKDGSVICHGYLEKDLFIEGEYNG